MITGLYLLPFALATLFISLRWKKGALQYVVLALLLGAEGVAAYYFDQPLIVYLLFIPTLAAFALFYADEPRYASSLTKPWQIVVIVLFGATLLSFVPPRPGVFWAAALYLLFLLDEAGLGHPVTVVAIIAFYNLLGLIADFALFYGLAALSFALFFVLTLFTRKRFADTTEKQVADALLAYSEEVQATHLQMRSWRHDFHNHLQSMKYLQQQGKTAELTKYLDELEESLKSVDTMVKSGQVSVDAILNSKLSLAKAARIDLDVTVYPLPELGISDIDLTGLLGNLLDNAIEACEKIPEEERFIRLYLDCMGEQLYLSIQNSAKQELNFNERNYISEKRGRHGLGMKRVALVVEKYNGVLNLQNEPGIFAAEVTLALPKSDAR